MARSAWNREEHARIADEWLSLPVPRPSLYSFLKEKKYRVSQKSIQNELERRGLNRITGEPEESPKEGPDPSEETEVEDVKEPASSGIIATTVAKVEPVPEPPQEEPEKPVGEKPIPTKPEKEEPEARGGGSMIGFVALGTVAVAVAGLIVVMNKKQKGRSAVQNVGTAQFDGGSNYRPNTELHGGYRRGLQLRTIDDYR